MKEETSEEDISFIPPKNDDKVSRNFRKRNRKKERRSPEKIVFHDKEPSFKWLLKLSLIGIILLIGAGIAWIWDDQISNKTPLTSDNVIETDQPIDQLSDSQAPNNNIEETQTQDEPSFWSYWFGTGETGEETDLEEQDNSNFEHLENSRADEFDNSNYESDYYERSDTPPEYISPPSYQETFSNDLPAYKDIEVDNKAAHNYYDNVDHQHINQVNPDHSNTGQSFNKETQIPSNDKFINSDHHRGEPWLWKQEHLDDLEYKLEVEQMEKARQYVESLGEEARRLEEPQNKEVKNVKISEFFECYEGNNNECENTQDRKDVNLNKARLDLNEYKTPQYDERYNEFSEAQKQINQEQDQRNSESIDEIYSSHRVNTEHQFEFDPSKESVNHVRDENIYLDPKQENRDVLNENNEKQKANIEDDQIHSDNRLNTDESINSLNNQSTAEHQSNEAFERNNDLYYW